MKSLLVAALMLASTCGVFASDVSTVPFAIGPKSFADGDRIVIEAVSSTSPDFAVGDKVTVRGKCTLGSHTNARLCLFLTAEGDVGPESTLSTQESRVQKGSGNFELTTVLQHPGHLHLSFYTAEGGNRFGTVYFGTEQQMKKISNWNVRD